MARPLKKGIDYFPLDVNIFRNLKIRKIMRSCGANALSTLICLLCKIYQEDGFYIGWDEELPFLVADEVGTSEGLVVEVVKKAIQVGFFDEEKFTTFNILTSESIQKRYFEAVSKRKSVEFPRDFLCKNVNVIHNGVNVCNNSINVAHNPQSKVNKSKVDDVETVTSAESGKKLEEFEKIRSAWNAISEIEDLDIHDMADVERLMTLKSTEDILVAINKIRESDFLKGLKSDWKIDFKWFSHVPNFQKVFSGAYRNRASRGEPRPGFKTGAHLASKTRDYGELKKLMQRNLGGR